MLFFFFFNNLILQFIFNSYKIQPEIHLDPIFSLECEAVGYSYKPSTHNLIDYFNFFFYQQETSDSGGKDRPEVRCGFEQRPCGSGWWLRFYKA